MRYQDKWKLFLEQTLLEGTPRDQTSVALEKYPQMKRILNHLDEKDETPDSFVKKHALWLAKKIKEKIDLIYDLIGQRVPEEDQYDPDNHRVEMEKIINAINAYPRLRQGQSSRRKNVENENDFKLKPNVEGKNGYRSIDKFISAVAQASEGRKDTEGYKKYIERASQIEGDIIYNNSRELIVVTIADNFEESCDLGYPAWCVSHPPTQGAYYDSYKNKGDRIYFIHHFFIPKTRIASEPFSKTAIQKELNGKTILWDERDNAQEIDDYQNWLREKLGSEKGSAIFKAIDSAITENWEENSKPKNYALSQRDVGDLEREIKYNIAELLRVKTYYDTETHPPIFNFRRMFRKREFEPTDFFRSLNGDWLVNLGELKLGFNLTYKSLGMEEYVISQINDEIENLIYDNLQDQIGKWTSEFDFPTVGIEIDMEDDGVIINFTFKIYAYLYYGSRAGVRDLIPDGLGRQNKNDKSLITKAIPGYLEAADKIIFNTVENNTRKASKTISERKNKLNRIIIRVG